MPISQGIYKQTRFKRQTALGTPASGASGGYIIRRKSSDFQLKRDTYDTSDEIASHQQLISERQGTQMVEGKLGALVSPGTYADLLAALLRRDFTVGINSTALTNVTAASTSGAQGTFTRAAGSWLTDGFKVLDVISWTGWTTGGVNNNAKNMLILSLTATVMTVLTLDGTAVAAKAAGDSVTATVRGKKTFTPVSGHTNVYYTVEEWAPDITVSEVSTDVKVASAAVKIPGNGNVEMDFSFVGLNQNAPAASAYFSSPSAETTSDVVSSATGALIVNGAVIAVVTGINFTIDGQEVAADGVVGTRLRPDVFRKKLRVKGDFTAYFVDSTLDNLFRNETECNMGVVMTASSAALADFVSFSMSRIKVQASDPSDDEKGRTRQYQFTGLYNFAGGAATANEQTTITVQDSLAP